MLIQNYKKYVSFLLLCLNTLKKPELMDGNNPFSRKVLITGATSGLGLSLVNHFQSKDYEVVGTGRNLKDLSDANEKFKFLPVDFSSLENTALNIKQISSTFRFDIIINNAGVLSPPDLQITKDGFEYSFQVNFLAHLLLNEIILRNTGHERLIKIISIVSPAYKVADRHFDFKYINSRYRPFKAYANAKLYLSLMCSYLPDRHRLLNLRCFGFDPGVFRSGIYRMQKEWFRISYGFAAPLMRNPDKIAAKFYETISTTDLVNGTIYRHDGKTERLPDIAEDDANHFWSECYRIIEPYMV